VFEKTWSATQKNVKSHVFLDFEKNVKKVHSFTGHLITQPLITQLPEVTVPVSHGHQHQTSCSEVWTQKTMQLKTVCDKRLYVPITSGSFEAKISIDIQQTFSFFVTMLASLRTKFLHGIFTFFFRVISKKRKKSCFLKSEKKRKYVFSNTDLSGSSVGRMMETRVQGMLVRHWFRLIGPSDGMVTPTRD